MMGVNTTNNGWVATYIAGRIILALGSNSNIAAMSRMCLFLCRVI